MRPGASTTRVGGAHDGALVVRVQQRAVDGAATDAVLRALADAFAVPPRAVTCSSGHFSRRKVIDVTGNEVALEQRHRELLAETLLP